MCSLQEIYTTTSCVAFHDRGLFYFKDSKGPFDAFTDLDMVKAEWKVGEVQDFEMQTVTEEYLEHCFSVKHSVNTIYLHLRRCFEIVLSFGHFQVMLN